MNNTLGLALNEVAHLEYEMTNCAYGYEHVLLALRSEETYSQTAAALTQQLEDYKRSYMTARQRLLHIDSQRLLDFECDLQMQKNLVFVRHDSLQ